MTKRKVNEIRGRPVKEHERKLDRLYFHIFLHHVTTTNQVLY